MNMRHDAFAGLPSPAAARPLSEARIVPLTRQLTALFFDRPSGGRARVSARLDGQPVPPPCLGSALALAAGGLRHLLLLRQPATAILAARLELALDGRPEAGAEPDWLQPPLDALPALVAGLSPAGRAQLLKLMLTTGASLFGAAEELAPLARRLLDLCAVPVLPAQARAAFGAGQAILTHAGRAATAGRVTAVALAPARLVALPAAELRPDPEAARLHLHLAAPPAPGTELVIFAPDPLRLAPFEARPLPLAQWLQGRSEGTRDWALGRVRAAAGAGDAAAAALLRELRHPDLPVRYQSLSATAVPGGLLHAFRLADPEGLVRALRFEAGEARAEIAPTTGPDGHALWAGLVPLPGLEEGMVCRVQLVLGSGRLRPLDELRPGALTAGVPAGFRAAWQARGAQDPAAALAEGWLRLPYRALPFRIESFGPDRPARLALIAPLGTLPDMIAARAAALAAEPRSRRVEVILTAPDGPALAAARPFLRSAAEVHGLPHRLVAHAPGATPVEALRMALLLCRGPALLLDAEVMPGGPGWLQDWHRHLALASAPVTAGAVLDHEGAIAAACLEAGEDSLSRPLDGLPAARLPGAGQTALAATGCTGLTREGAARLLAASHGAPDVALALAALAGGAPVELRSAHPFVRYAAPDAPDAFADALLAHGLRSLACPPESP